MRQLKLGRKRNEKDKGTIVYDKDRKKRNGEILMSDNTLKSIAKVIVFIARMLTMLVRLVSGACIIIMPLLKGGLPGVILIFLIQIGSVIICKGIYYASMKIIYMIGTFFSSDQPEENADGALTLKEETP